MFFIVGESLVCENVIKEICVRTDGAFLDLNETAGREVRLANIEHLLAYLRSPQLTFVAVDGGWVNARFVREICLEEPPAVILTDGSHRSVHANGIATVMAVACQMSPDCAAGCHVDPPRECLAG